MIDETQIKLEVCENTEWLTVFGPLCGIVNADYEKEAASFFSSELHANLSEAGFTTRSPKGQRILCHGWNGANTFVHKLGPVGTFDDLSTDQVNVVIGVIDSAASATASRFPVEVSE